MECARLIFQCRIPALRAIGVRVVISRSLFWSSPPNESSRISRDVGISGYNAHVVEPREKFCAFNVHGVNQRAVSAR